jgi:CheY-like chemotaxis protein
MANILLLDESDVAGRAMRGILARGNHNCFIATESTQAWTMLREGVVFDLMFMELMLADSSGAAFLQRVREDAFWKVLPVVVYTADKSPVQIKRALSLNIQNYLIKPYNEEFIFTEVDKAVRNPWRNLLFEEVKSFCAMLGLTPEKLVEMRRAVMTSFDEAAQNFPAWAESRQNQEVFAKIDALADDAESAGIWAGVDYLRYLHAQAEVANWGAFKTCAEYLEFASRLIFCQLNPSYSPDCMRTEAQQNEAKEAADRARWEHIDVEQSGPVVDFESLKKQVDGMAGAPVIDSAAAAFEMVADGRAATMSQVMDLVAADPGLTTQILMAANRLEQDELSEAEDARTGCGRLGEIRLKALAKTLPTAFERHMELAPLTWSSFWMFQTAVGRMAQFICSYLEFNYLDTHAYTAGLLHDIGKLLLLKLHPFGLQAIVRYSREKKVALADAERKYLGCTTRELATYFAESQRLPRVYANVIRWVETPALAIENTDLIAIISVARHVCEQNHVGCWGDLPLPRHSEIAETAGWSILQQRLFPSFDLKKFELQAHAFCLNLRSELSGQRGDRRPSLAQRAAELV